ncbi:MAG: serine--tRNA ligase [Rhizomicrobium sp.]
MHDIRFIRDNTDAFVAALARRPAYADSAKSETRNILSADEDLRTLLTELQQKQARRNEASKLIGQAKANLALKQRSGSATKEDEAGAAALMAEVATIKDAIQAGEAKQRALEEALKNLLAVLPNLPAEDVPQGEDEHANVPVPERGFKAAHIPASGINQPKEHFELGEKLGLMDFERAAKVSGARFVYLKGALARLNRALASFMLDSHTTNYGYEEVVPPMLVRNSAMFGTGQLPKFADDLYRVSGSTTLDQVTRIETNDLDARIEKGGAQEIVELYWLIPTAEVPLTNYVNGEILAEAELPIRFTAYTPCFRSEAGAAGKDTRGMIRMHQFDKVELVSITAPEQSNAEHERMTDAAQAILKALDLRHRVVTLCTGDMGFGARKTYDIEVWLPGQNRYREISSCSNCGDFQARRMNTRYRGQDGKVKGPIHTLNGSGLAIGRTLIAILENYQDADGAIAIPDALRPYMGGLEKIAAR